MSTLDGVLPGPLPGGGLVAGAVGLVDMCDLGNEGVVGVGVCEHGADGEEHCMCVSGLGVHGPSRWPGWRAVACA